MKLKKLVKRLAAETEIKDRDEEVNIAIMFTHSQETNNIGVIPYASEGNPLQVVEYLAQGFLQECEILLMYQSLITIKEQNPKLFDKCKEVLIEKNYPNYKEVMDRIILKNPNGVENSEVA